MQVTHPWPTPPTANHPTKRRLLILFGSQTGTAEDVAIQISNRARRLHFSTELSSMDQYQSDRLLHQHQIIIFVCSTTGQGIEPQNMSNFWTRLRRSNLPNDLLDPIRFTIFGLGDSSYPKFNWVAKKLFRRLLQLGARSILPPGLADDQHHNGIDSTLLPWSQALWETLLTLEPLPQGLDPIPSNTLLPPSFRLQRHPPSSSSQPQPLPDHQIAILTKNQRLTPTDHWQDTRHLEFESSQPFDFEPGSVCQVWPENSPEDVDRLLKRMDWTDLADQVYKLSRTEPNQHLPIGWSQYATLTEIFKSRLDLTAVPSRSFIEWLSFFTTDSNETERLQEFCSIDGQDDLHEYVRRPRRTILEVLSEFKSAIIPLDYIHDVFPPIRPRQFSISSSPKVFPNQIHLLVAVVKYKTRLSIPRKGLCTSWLARLAPGARIPVKIVRGYLKLPKNPEAPVICIGPGTGIAPFRSLIQDRSKSHVRSASSVEPTLQDDEPTTSTNNLVIFGCRFESKDFYYRQEWSEFERGRLCRFLWTASRDQIHKRYVQNLIEENPDQVWELIDVQKASIFISGSSGEMPKGVRASLRKVFTHRGGLDSDESAKLLERLESTGRLQEETWS